MRLKSKLSLFWQKLGRSGMSMAEVMVAAGAAAGLSLVLAQLNKNSVNQQAVVSAKNDFEIMSSQINTVLSNPTACGSTMSSLDAAAITAMSSAAGHPITQIRDKTASVVFQTTAPATKLGKATVSSLRLKNYNAAADTANLEIRATYMINKKTMETRIKTIPINIDATASSVSYCAAGSNADVGPWEKLPIPALGIYYNQGSVLIGTGSVNTNSTNPAFAMGDSNNVSAILSAAFGTNNNVNGGVSYVFGTANNVNSPTSFVSGANNNVNTVNNTVVLGNNNMINDGGNDTFISAVIGNENQIHGRLLENNYVVGHRNEFHGEVMNNFYIGTQNQAHNTSDNYLFGQRNQAHGTSNLNMAVGLDNAFHGDSNQSFALGQANNFNATGRSTAIGVSNTLATSATFAFGMNNNVNATSSMAIGNAINVSASGSLGLSDLSGSPTNVNVPNAFIARFNGGYTFNTETTQSNQRNVRINALNGFMAIYNPNVPLSPLAVGNHAGNSQWMASFYSNIAGHTTDVVGHVTPTNGAYQQVGVNGTCSGPNVSSYCTGVYGNGQFSNAAAAGRSYGVRGIAGNGNPGSNYGLHGTIAGTHGGAAVFGTTVGDVDVGATKWAGYFNGPVKVTNGIIEQDAWVNLPYGAGYGTKPGYAAASFYKDSMGRINLRGVIKDISMVCRMGGSFTLAVLPVGARPSAREVFAVGAYVEGPDTSGETVRHGTWNVEIDTVGNIIWNVPTGASGTCGIEWFSLSGISFRL